jgi:hypothetical protein
VGFAHTFLGQDATWGAFLDNLHVAYGLKRQGIGTRLLTLTAQAVLDWSPASGLYLWVLEQNSDARAFYTAGRCLRGARPSPAARRRPRPAQRQADQPDIRMARPIPATCKPPITALRSWRALRIEPPSAPMTGSDSPDSRYPRETGRATEPSPRSADDPVRHAPERSGARRNHRP